MQDLLSWLVTYISLVTMEILLKECTASLNLAHHRVPGISVKIWPNYFQISKYYQKLG